MPYGYTYGLTTFSMQCVTVVHILHAIKHTSECCSAPRVRSPGITSHVKAIGDIDLELV